jgi:uncharacterized protein
MIEVRVENIRVSLMSQSHVAILKEQDGPRYIAIWIGRYEAESIRLALDGDVPPRPLTHDLTLNMLHALDAKIERVVVSDIYNDVFYARIEIVGPDGRRHNIDARSSDGVAIAVRAKCPLLVEDDVMERAGQMPDETDEPEAAAGDDLGAFGDFINTMDLDDLDNKKE